MLDTKCVTLAASMSNIIRRQSWNVCLEVEYFARVSSMYDNSMDNVCNGK